VICTDHDSIDYQLLADRCPLIVDTRNAFAARGITGGLVVKA
jgi:UDP-N-acetyl-D-glucosamine dehydrogenase